MLIEMLIYVNYTKIAVMETLLWHEFKLCMEIIHKLSIRDALNCIYFVSTPSTPESATRQSVWMMSESFFSSLKSLYIYFVSKLGLDSQPTSQPTHWECPGAPCGHHIPEWS